VRVGNNHATFLRRGGLLHSIPDAIERFWVHLMQGKSK